MVRDYRFLSRIRVQENVKGRFGGPRSILWICGCIDGRTSDNCDFSILLIPAFLIFCFFCFLLLVFNFSLSGVSSGFAFRLLLSELHL